MQIGDKVVLKGEIIEIRQKRKNGDVETSVVVKVVGSIGLLETIEVKADVLRIE